MMIGFRWGYRGTTRLDLVIGPTGQTIRSGGITDSSDGVNRSVMSAGTDVIAKLDSAFTC